MRILQVIHGYPPIYNAGSEVYTQMLCQGLLNKGADLRVFSREEDPFRPDYTMREEVDTRDPRIKLLLVNMARDRERYVHHEVDQRFRETMMDFDPDIVHIQHLNHLSLTIPTVANALGVPTVFTLHDFWLMCPRGQFLQFGLGDLDTWRLCAGQNDKKCAEVCYSRYHRGLDDKQLDTTYWTKWVQDRMKTSHDVTQVIDRFIAPSPTLCKHACSFGIPEEKLIRLDYGFDHQRLSSRSRNQDAEDEFVFGYIGTHIPAKGIHLLLEAFGHVKGEARLIIWGRERSQSTSALKAIQHRLPPNKREMIEWRPEYSNEDIISEVMDHIDAIVAPSIWLENSPLVIHEAQQARVPVITANIGGMKDYVDHETNGLLFEHRNSNDLTRIMQRFVDDPGLAKRLGARGYLFSDNGDVPSIEDHVRSIIRIYNKLLGR